MLRTWAFLALCVGCGVPLRPDGSPVEEKCPDRARETMESFGLRPGDHETIYIDVNRQERGPLVVYDGPIESVTWEPMKNLPGNVRLYGRIWTGGPRVVIRYYSARLPDGKVIPFCAMAAYGTGLGIPKTPGRPGSAAVESSLAFVSVMDRFRAGPVPLWDLRQP